MRYTWDLRYWFRPAPSATERSERLLISWLTPEQADSYKQHGYFTVIGCDSGERYIIRAYRPYSVVLGPDFTGWYRYICFVPQDVGDIGDQLLAQKIALENFELKALKMARGVLTRDAPTPLYNWQG